MTSYLQKQIQTRMAQKGFSVAGLEKRAGLKESAVKNILYGQSKKPSLEIVNAIAKALECSIQELIGETNSSKKTATNETVFKAELFTEATNSIINHLKETDKAITTEQVVELILETYKYSIDNSEDFIHDSVSKYLVKKHGQCFSVTQIAKRIGSKGI